MIREENLFHSKATKTYLLRLRGFIGFLTLCLIKTEDYTHTKIWNKSLTKNQKECFFINKESEFVRHFLDEFDDKDKRKILNFIDAVSSAIPFDDIYNSVCNKNNTTELEDEQLEAIILEGVAQFKRIKSLIQKGNDEVMAVLSKYEPFNDEKIAGRIKEIIDNENA